MDTDPELAVSLGQLSIRRSTHALDPRSPASFTDRLKYMKAALARFQALVDSNAAGVKQFSESKQLSVELYIDQLQTYVDNAKFQTYLCCLNRMEGPQNDLPLYASYLPLKTADNIAFYKSFLESTATQVNEVVELLKLGMTKKNLPAKCSLDGVTGQIQDLIDTSGAPFIAPAKAADPALPAATIAEFQSIIDTSVLPAFAALNAFLTATYLPVLSETDTPSSVRHPHGQEFYAACLKFHTTTDLTPQEVHDMGHAEVNRITASMESIAADEKFADLKSYIDHLKSSPEHEAPSGQALLTRYRDICSRIQPELLKLFHVKTLPRTPFTIVETPERSAAQAPAAYYLAGTGDRPGTFYVNTSSIAERRTYECDSLSLHEAIPGHHTQAAVSCENADLEDFRRYAEDRRYFEAPSRFPFYTGYIEGWGLHCEGLGDELGLYKTNADKFGRLSMEMLRACRLVVDTGLHSLGWTWQQAYEFMLEKSGCTELDARQETSRYVTWPGQATAYKVGELKLNELRKMWETEGQGKLDIRDFYHEVLTGGAVPLYILENKIKQMIKEGLAGEIKAVEKKDDIMGMMAFANGNAPWCKCCVVPGSHLLE